MKHYSESFHTIIFHIVSVSLYYKHLTILEVHFLYIQNSSELKSRGNSKKVRLIYVQQNRAIIMASQPIPPPNVPPPPEIRPYDQGLLTIGFP